MTIRETLWEGQSDAAVVISIQPLQIAIRTSLLDTSLPFQYPQDYVERYQLKVGDRLIAVMQYERGQMPAMDFWYNGPNAMEGVTNVFAFVAEFLSDDTEQIEKRKKEIDETTWEMTAAQANQNLRHERKWVRNGCSWDSWV